MSKKFAIFTVIISLLAIAISAAAITLSSYSLAKSNEISNKDVQYVMYVGTNDKDANTPVYSEEVSKEKAKEVLIELFGGYTIQEARGGWKDGDNVYQEYTIVIYLSDTTLADVHKAADRFITIFNQSSILIQSNQTVTEFYAGK